MTYIYIIYNINIKRIITQMFIISKRRLRNLRMGTSQYFSEDDIRMIRSIGDDDYVTCCQIPNQSCMTGNLYIM